LLLQRKVTFFNNSARSGAIPTSVIGGYSANPTLDEKTIAYFNDAVKTSVQRLLPLTSIFMMIPGLMESVVFTDITRNEESNLRSEEVGISAF
jgi:hypothetical protein